MYIPMEVSEGSWSNIDYKYYLTNYEIFSNEENYETRNNYRKYK